MIKLLLECLHLYVFIFLLGFQQLDVSTLADILTIPHNMNAYCYTLIQYSL